MKLAALLLNLSGNTAIQQGNLMRNQAFRDTMWGGNPCEVKQRPNLNERGTSKLAHPSRKRSRLESKLAHPLGELPQGEQLKVFEP